jgi:hypothetical protein
MVRIMIFMLCLFSWIAVDDDDDDNDDLTSISNTTHIVLSQLECRYFNR